MVPSIGGVRRVEGRRFGVGKHVQHVPYRDKANPFVQGVHLDSGLTDLSDTNLGLCVVAVR